jgi:MFS family permease
MSVSAAFGDVRRIAQGPTRTLFLGLLLKSIGSGLTLSLITVYLKEVRHFPVMTATALLAWQAVVTLGVSPVVGTLVDRRGPRPILLAALLIEAASMLAFGWVTTWQQAFVVMSVVAVGGAGIWGPTDALLARLVPSPDRSTAFGFQFMLLNIGLGLGGLISATIIDVNNPTTFVWLYALTALSFLALFVAVLVMGDVGGRPEADPGLRIAGQEAPTDSVAPESGRGGWAEVLRDRNLLRYGAVALLLLTFGYGCIESGLGLFILNYAHLGENRIGVVLAANTAVIVVMQMFTISFVNGRSRAQMLAGVGVLWAVTWALATSSLVLTGWLVLGALILAMSVFALGETLWSPVAPALLNELAPEHLRGRYNSFQSLLWGVSGAIGPLVTGLFLSADLGKAWALTLTAGCLLAAFIALRMRHHLTPRQDGLAEDDSEDSPDDDPDPARPNRDPDLDPSYPVDAH